MRINHNLAALNTYNKLDSNSAKGAKSLEKLSSGLRINRAGDDAAGLAISEKMRGQIRGLDQASRNSQDGISLLQTAEGALNETTAIIQRMRELVVQGNNGTNTLTDRQSMKAEVNQLQTEVSGIATRTQFNNTTLLNGSVGVGIDGTAAGTDAKVLTDTGVKITNTGLLTSSAISISIVSFSISAKYTFNGTTQIQKISIGAANATDSIAVGSVFDFNQIGIKLEFQALYTQASAVGLTFDVSTNASSAIDIQIGANGNQKLQVSISDMQVGALGTSAVAGKSLNSIDPSDFTTITFDNQLAIIDEALADVSTQRGALGAMQNRLEHTIANLSTSSENMTAAESRVRDVDMAKEMMEFTKNNILTQAAQSMLAQANQQPQGVLQLLR